MKPESNAKFISSAGLFSAIALLNPQKLGFRYPARSPEISGFSSWESWLMQSVPRGDGTCFCNEVNRRDYYVSIVRKYRIWSKHVFFVYALLYKGIELSNHFIFKRLLSSVLNVYFSSCFLMRSNKCEIYKAVFLLIKFHEINRVGFATEKNLILTDS